LALTACGGGGGGADVGSAGTTPVVVSSVAQPTASEALPARILGCYFTAWDTTCRITDVPADFNVIYLFNAQNGGSNTGDGSWTWPFANEVPAAQIQQVRQRGQKVILTVGGAGLGFAYTNRAQSTNCVNSIKNIIGNIGGVDGVDFNNFEGGVVNAGNVAAMSTEMVWIAQQMRATYGPDFAITSPPGGFATGSAPVAGIAAGSGESLQLMGAMNDAGVLTYAGPQYYDWSFYKGPGVVSAITDEWCQRLGADKVTVGLSANYDFASSLTLAECQREMSSILAAHPDIRGVFCWSAQNNINSGNAWGSIMKAALS
jgi:chitinase